MFFSNVDEFDVESTGCSRKSAGGQAAPWKTMQLLNGFSSLKNILRQPFAIHAVFLLLACMGVFAAYYNSIDGPFLHDDYNYVAGNPAIEISSLSLAELKKAAFESRLSSRVLPNVTFALTYYFLGEEAGGFRLVNIIIHICTAFAVFLLFRATLQLECFRSRFPRGGEIAFLAALLWAVHPLMTNSVTYIVQRMTSMAALFSICSLLLYIHGRLAATSRVRRICYILAATSGVCAFLSKENSAMLPFMVLAYELFFLRDFDWRKQYKTALVALTVLVVAFSLLALFYFNGDFNFLEGYRKRDFTLTERLLTQTRVVLYYLSLILLPLPSRLNFLHDIPLSAGLFNPPQTFFAILFIAAALGGIFVFHKRHRLVSFAILWYLGNLVIESSVLPLELMYEHRTYLPSIMVVLALCAYLYRLEAVHRLLPGVCLGVLIVLFGCFTWQRNLVWADTRVFWQDVVNKSPGLARGYLGLYSSFRAQGRTAEAREYLEKAYAVDPYNDVTVVNITRDYIAGQRFREARTVLDAFLPKKQTAETLLLSAVVYGFLGDPANAEKEAQRTVAFDPGSATAYRALGEAQRQQKKYRQALANYQTALNLGLKTAPLLSIIGTIHLELADIDNAIHFFRESLRMDPDNRQSHYYLSLAYGKKGMEEDAAREMRLSRQLPARSATVPVSPHNF